MFSLYLINSFLARGSNKHISAFNYGNYGNYGKEKLYIDLDKFDNITANNTENNLCTDMKITKQ